MIRAARKRWIQIVAASLASTLLVLGIADSASANTSGVSGSGTAGNTYYNATHYINSNAQNQVMFDYTSMNVDGGAMDFYLSQAGFGSYIYSEVDNAAYNTWYLMKYKPTGSTVWPTGGFYLGYYFSDQCGGSCGTYTWGGNLEWNLLY
jgi:hypothetical protein